MVNNLEIRRAELAEWYSNHEEYLLSEIQILHIESDLSRLLSTYLYLLENVAFSTNEASITTCDTMRHRYLRDGSITVQYSNERVHGIDPFFYWGYRAIHDVINHCVMQNDFTFDGEYQAWLEMKRLMGKMSFFSYTKAFVRCDILYKNASYHKGEEHFKGLVLSPWLDYLVTENDCSIF